MREPIERKKKMPKLDSQRLRKQELSETQYKLQYFIKSKKSSILKCTIILLNTKKEKNNTDNYNCMATFRDASMWEKKCLSQEE